MGNRTHVVIGAGRVGRLVASRFSAAGQDVVVIERDAARAAKLPPEFSGVVILGDAADRGTLEEAALKPDSRVFALTDDDNLNFFLALTVRTLFHVPDVVARVNDPAKERLFRDFGVETINPTSLAAGHLVDSATMADWSGS